MVVTFGPEGITGHPDHITEWIGRGQEPFDPDTVYHPRGIPREAIDFVVDTSSIADRVRAAMREHRSQWHDLNPAYLTEEQLRRNVSREPNVIAWPKRPPNRHLTNIFQDLLWFMVPGRHQRFLSG